MLQIQQVKKTDLDAEQLQQVKIRQVRSREKFQRQELIKAIDLERKKCRQELEGEIIGLEKDVLERRRRDLQDNQKKIQRQSDQKKILKLNYNVFSLYNKFSNSSNSNLKNSSSSSSSLITESSEKEKVVKKEVKTTSQQLLVDYPSPRLEPTWLQFSNLATIKKKYGAKGREKSNSNSEELEQELILRPDKSNLCRVCLNAIPDMIIFPCQHIAVCGNCWLKKEEIENSGFENCPICCEKISVCKKY